MQKQLVSVAVSPHRWRVPSGSGCTPLALTFRGERGAVASERSVAIYGDLRGLAEEGVAQRSQSTGEVVNRGRTVRGEPRERLTAGGVARDRALTVCREHGVGHQAASGSVRRASAVVRRGGTQPLKGDVLAALTFAPVAVAVREPATALFCGEGERHMGSPSSLYGLCRCALQRRVLFTLWIGTNDVARNCLLTGPSNPDISLVDTTACAVNWVKTMYTSGARNFLFQNILSHSPFNDHATARGAPHWALALEEFYFCIIDFASLAFCAQERILNDHVTGKSLGLYLQVARGPLYHYPATTVLNNISWESWRDPGICWEDIRRRLPVDCGFHCRMHGKAVTAEAELLFRVPPPDLMEPHSAIRPVPFPFKYMDIPSIDTEAITIHPDSCSLRKITRTSLI
ncbi:hypothetical protein GGX14DRAFT_397191 [Mycena pura]|uniref:Uncharacterized protein n=1 Tax=Mycena pura TaxID=153505 RepID=A0AAD6VA19_9AGAR|nr:hypothetical protein GGX14DRAFT_397191 [Mycena pura]